MPAIIISDQRERDVTDLGLARELGLLQVCHADDAHSPASINFRLCLGGKRRPLHAQICAAAMGLNVSNLARLFKHVAQFLANGMSESHMRHDALTKEGRFTRACSSPVKKLIGNHHVERCVPLLERTYCGG